MTEAATENPPFITKKIEAKVAANPVLVKKPSKLKAVDPKSTEPSKPKMLIYGKPGVGKTWTSLDFPAVYYMDSEGGADLEHYTDKLKKSGGVYFGVEHGALSFEAIIEQVQALATEQHAYKTLVIDSITKIFNTAITDEGERLAREGKKNEFGLDKKPAVYQIKRLISWLQRLDMNVILIAHQKPLWGADKDGNRAEIGTTFDCWDKLEYELHLCLQIEKNGPSRIARVKKTRLREFPDASNFSWSYDEFSKLYGKDVIEKKSETLVLATSEQVAEINTLLELVKLPDGEVEKWFNKADVTSFAEMDERKILACIAAMKQKIKGE